MEWNIKVRFIACFVKVVSIVCWCACACILGYNINCVLLGMIHGNWVAQKVHSSTAYCSLGLMSHLRNRSTASL